MPGDDEGGIRGWDTRGDGGNMTGGEWESGSLGMECTTRAHETRTERSLQATESAQRALGRRRHRTTTRHIIQTARRRQTQPSPSMSGVLSSSASQREVDARLHPSDAPGSHPTHHLSARLNSHRSLDRRLNGKLSHPDSRHSDRPCHLASALRLCLLISRQPVSPSLGVSLGMGTDWSFVRVGFAEDNGEGSVPLLTQAWERR